MSIKTKNSILAIILAATPLFLLAATPEGTITELSSRYNGQLLMKEGEILLVKSNGKKLYFIEPELREYNNLVSGRPAAYIEKIVYHTTATPTPNNLRFPVKDTDYGTYYIADKDLGKFESDLPPHLAYPGSVLQIVYRKDDTYIGYLTELFRTPFVIMPKRTKAGKNQADLHMGSDCASFAIYGMRRMGFDYPYIGPQRIYQFLRSLYPSILRPIERKGTIAYYDAGGDSPNGGSMPQPGDILHFGEQVTVFYQDAGVIGMLDSDDLIIHSTILQPEITTIRKSAFNKHALRIFRWKKSDKSDSSDRSDRSDKEDPK